MICSQVDISANSLLRLLSLWLTFASLTGMLVASPSAYAAACGNEVSISIGDTGFTPEQVCVISGGSINWTNNSTGDQTVTEPTGRFDSGVIKPGTRYSITVKVPGSHRYKSLISPAASGEIIISVSGLAGAPDELANNNIPQIDFPTTLETDLSEHPIWGELYSRKRILIGFNADATVQQANDALAAANVDVVGALQSMGILLLFAEDSADFSTLFAALESLRADSAIEFASGSPVLRLGSIPRPADPETLDALDNDLNDPEKPVLDWQWSTHRNSDETQIRGSGGNVILEAIRAPMAWNWRETIVRLNRSAEVTTLIFDLGFEAHQDFPAEIFNRKPICKYSGTLCTTIDFTGFDHAMVISGVLGAAYDNNYGADGSRSLGLSGVNPHAQVRAINASFQNTINFDSTTVTEFHQLIDLGIDQIPYLRIANFSFWHPPIGKFQSAADHWWAKQGVSPVCGPGPKDDNQPGSNQICTPNNDDDWLREVEQLGMKWRRYYERLSAANVVVAKIAGNDSSEPGLCQDASTAPDCLKVAINTKVATPAGWVSRHWVHPTLPNPILMVEAVGPDNARSAYSNVGGDISAPADMFASVVKNNSYLGRRRGGTSTAAPVVAGVAGILLAYNPDLSNAQVIEILKNSSSDTVSGGGAGLVDAFAAMLALPGAAHALVDINDESLDGNRRVILGPPVSGSSLGQVLGPDSFSSSTVDPTTGQRYRTEPDGVINMRDFRRFRDARIQICLEQGLEKCPDLTGPLLNPTVPFLDGAAYHPKKDLNFDRCVYNTTVAGCPEEFNFSRFDFNGDGFVSGVGTWPVPLNPVDGTPLASGEDVPEMTDLEVMMALWDLDLNNTEGYSAGDLPGLMNSADIIVYADQFFEQGATEVKVSILDTVNGKKLPERSIPVGGHIVYTVPAGINLKIVGSAMIGDQQVFTDSPLFILPNAGLDVAMELCRSRLILNASPLNLEADGTSTSFITAEFETCDTADSVLPNVEFDSNLVGGNHGVLSSSSVPFDSNHRAVTEFHAGTEIAEYHISALVSVEFGPGNISVFSDTVRIQTQTTKTTKIYYRWQQEVLSFTENGTNRWPAGTPGIKGDCDGHVLEITQDLAGTTYNTEYHDGVPLTERPPVDADHGRISGWYKCVDQFLHQIPAPGQPNPVLTREGKLTPKTSGAVILEETVAESKITGRIDFKSSRSNNLAFTDPIDNLYGTWEAIVAPTNRSQFVNLEVPGTIRILNDAEGLHIEKLSDLSNLSYEYDGAWTVNGTIVGGTPTSGTHFGGGPGDVLDGIGTFATATMQREFLLVSRPDRSAIRYTADNNEDVLRFSRDNQGAYQPYRYCEVVERDFIREPGYISSSDIYIDSVSGKTHGLWRRNQTFWPFDAPFDPNQVSSFTHEYPQPVGPVNSRYKYSFVAIPYSTETELNTLHASGVLDQPNCDVSETLSVDFNIAATPTEEGDIIYFTDLSTSPGNSIVSWLWHFGDGTVSQAQYPNHRYIDNGDYTVDLAVTDSLGVMQTSNQTVTVHNVAPQIQIDEAVASIGDTALIVMRLADPGEADQVDLRVLITSSNVNWQTIPVQYSAGIQVLQLHGLAPGVYPLTAQITDKDNASTTANATLTITGEGEAPPAPPPPPLGITTCDATVVLDGEEKAFLDALNDYRIESGVPPLVASPGLSRAAARHSLDMASNAFLNHIGSDGSTPEQRAQQSGYPTTLIDENVLEGLATGNNALFAWKASPTHNENLLNPLWNAIGIGRSEGNEWYWTADFDEIIDCPDMAAVESEQVQLLAIAGLAPPISDAPKVMSHLAGGDEIVVGRTTSLDVSSVSDMYGPTTALAVSKGSLITGEIFTARNLSRNEDGIALPATINFGDGRVVNLDPNQTIGHAYALQNNYAIILTSTDANTASTLVAINVNAIGDTVDPGGLPGGNVDPNAEPDFNLLLSPISQVINPGSSVNFVVTLTSVGGFAEPVTLSLGALPPGVTGIFLGSVVTPTGSQTLQITVDANTELSDFSLNITATGGGKSHTTTSAVTLDFGLVPICTGTFAGQVRDKDTGEILTNALIFNTPVDSEGRYFLDGLSVGPNNEPIIIGVSADAPFYWPGEGSGLAECGRVTEVNIVLSRQRTSAISGRVTVGSINPNDASHTVVSTSEPIEDAIVRGSFKNDLSDVDGNYLIENIPLGRDNRPTLIGADALKDDFWNATTVAVTLLPGQVHQVDFSLVRKCFTGDISFTIRYPDGTPASGIDIQYQNRKITTDATGSVSHGPVEMGYNNTPLLLSVKSPAPRVPSSEVLVDAEWAIKECDQPIHTDILATRRFRNEASLEITVSDEETRDPIEDVTARIGVSGRFSLSEQTDTQGVAYFDALFLGFDTENRQTGSASAIHADYWAPFGSSVTLEANKTAQVEIELLRKRYAMVHIMVTDVTTGKPIEAARVDGAGALFTDETGLVEFEKWGLLRRNAPGQGLVTVTKEGYWQTKSNSFLVEADTTTNIDVKLLPVCDGATVRGTVVNAITGEPIEGAEVIIIGQSIMLTDELGRYEFTEVQVGKENSPKQITIQASKTGFITQTRFPTIFCNANVTVEFGESQSEFGAIEGTVTDAEGAPLTDVFIGSGFGAATSTDENGDYFLTEVPLAALAADREWSITADPENKSAKTATVVATEAQVVRLDFIFDENDAPVANAGPDQNAHTGDPVILDGSDSFDPNGDLISFNWSLDRGSKPLSSVLNDADLTNSTTPNASFTPDVDGTYLLELIVSNAEQESVPDIVSIMASTQNTPPNANAGVDQNAFLGDNIQLDGSTSDDPDNSPDPLSFLWQFQQLPMGSNLDNSNINNADSTQADFNPDIDGIFKLNLTVNDGFANDTDTVDIAVMLRNVPPNARAGNDSDLLLGKQAHLDGSASDDPDASPEALVYAWRFVSIPDGSSLANHAITAINSPQPSFTPDVPGSYVMELRVFDGEAEDFDNVQLNVTRPNLPPIADAGPDQVLIIGSNAVLDGSNSSDPDNNPLPLFFSWEWKFLSLPPSSTLTNANLGNATSASSDFTPDVLGIYVLTLTVSDGLDSAEDNVSVAVEEQSGTPPPPPPPPPEPIDTQVLDIQDVPALSLISLIGLVFGVLGIGVISYRKVKRFNS